MKDIDQTYQQAINDVFNQYKKTISSRAASGDMPDPCVKEVVCAVEQFKTRILARANKMGRATMTDQMTKSIKAALEKKGVDTGKVNVVADDLAQIMNTLSNNKEFNQLDAEQKAAVVQAKVDQVIREKYQNDPNVQTITEEVRSATLPLIRNHIEQLQPNELEQRERMDQPTLQSKRVSMKHSSERSINSSNASSSRDEHISHERNQKGHRRVSPTQRNRSHRRRGSFDRQQKSGTSIPFSACTDYDPYGNYAKYKAKRLQENKQNHVV